MEKPLFIVSKEDWSLHRKGYLDQERHQAKVREAIRQNLADLVSEESIIMTDGRETIRVPVRSIQEYHFRYNYSNQEQVGQGQGDAKVGDLVARGQPAPGSGKGPGAGDSPGEDYYEAEITVDELAELIFEDLELPRLKRKSAQELREPDIQFHDVRKQGIMGNVDKRRTLLESIKRHSLAGGAGDLQIQRDDLRFKSWEMRERPSSQAVVLAMMDTSGSMGTFEKYIARSFFFWMVRFLRTKYQHVQIAFLAHDTEAKEVTEQQFFTKGESGGTRCSSVYELALQLVEQRYRPERYNLYAFHFSDGDNLSSDNPKTVELVEQLLARCNMVGYGEITRFMRDSTLMTELRKIRNPHFVRCTIAQKSDVYRALRNFFKEQMEETE
ncbi:sporulation protein YhbH [Effusibacillus pohliae]|uniref:sporulation protein YhbH n=1 Tax=Effusibacillus pohliae TaxID=232270 RepID=UPI00037158F2|nr:sporulation protein YhbH [Effusibacillus pohliae]